MSFTRQICCVLPAAAVAIMAGQTQASSLGWVNAAGGSASVAGNWSPAQVPAGVDDLVWNLNNVYNVTFNASVLSSHTQTYRKGSVTLTFSSPHTVSTGMIVGDQSTDDAVMTVTTGTLTSNGSATIGNVSGSNGRINVNDDDADLIIGNAADLTVGLNGDGILEITGTGHVEVADQLIVGSNSTSTSSVLVSGFSVAPVSSSLLDVIGVGQSRIGAGGDSTLTVSNGALANFDGDVVIANGSASTSSVTAETAGLFNARFTVGGDLLVGRNTSATAAGAGTLNLNTGGTATVSGDTFLGDPNGGTGLLDMGGGTFDGPGVIDVLAGSAITGFGTINADVDNAGDIEPSGTGLIFNGILNNTTSNQIVGTKIKFGAGGGYTGSGTCQADITGDNGATITATRSLTIGANTTAGFSYNGALDVGGSIVTLLDSNGAVLGGLTTLNSGRVECPAGIGLANGGTIKGDGLLVGTLTASGIVDPESPGFGGLITVQGDLHMNPTGKVDIELSNDPGSGDYDKIVISGAATFDGEMRLKIKDGFMPHTGMQFIAVNAVNGRTGTFDNGFVTPDVQPCNGVTFVMVYSSTAAIVLVRPPDADANRDDKVNIDDLLFVINHWGPCPQEGGGCLGDTDGVQAPGPTGGVNIDDLLVVVNHWGCQ